MVILKFKEYNNINDIEKYKGKDLLVTRDLAVPLGEGEHFIYDIIGSDAVTEDGICIGTVCEILTTAANDVYVIKTGDGFNTLSSEIRDGKHIKEGTEILIPSIPDVVLNVDTEARKVTVRIPVGII